MSTENVPGTTPELNETEHRALAEAQTWVGGAINRVEIGRAKDGDEAIAVFVENAGAPEVHALPETVEGLPVVIQIG